MAHAANLRKLTASLVTSITGRNPEEAFFGKLADRTLKNIKNQSHARTNQFAVKAKLEGLVEKFSVLNREELATALEADLNELPQDSRWMPEILSFLLELSDRPVENTSLDDIDSEATSVVEEDLTWEDIIGDEPLEDPDLWADVERGYHSSGDDEFNHDLESEPTASTKATSLDEDPASIARLYLSQPDENSIKHIRSVREQGELLKQPDTVHNLSELTVVREILSMMHGLPTDLFDVDNTGQATVSSDVRIASVSGDSLRDLLDDAATTGSALNFLRQWVPDASHSYLQAIHGALETQISSLGTQLGIIERKYITPTAFVAVSALDVHTEIDDIATPLVHLSEIVERAAREDDQQAPFALLDELWRESELAHLAGDEHLFNALSAVFLAGLKSYVQAVARWVSHGVIVPQDCDILFAKDLHQDCAAGDFWWLRFEMRRLPDGLPYAPLCISARAPSLFALGKSQAFLNELNSGEEVHSGLNRTFQLPDFEHCLSKIADGSLAPFSELLDEALDTWIRDISNDCSPSLRAKLFSDHGLRKTLDALPSLLFSENGILFQDFADAVVARFSKAEHTKTRNDLFLMTELAHATFGASSDVDPESIYLTVDEEKDVSSARSLVRRIAQLTMGYRLSWPVQNVVQYATIDAHSKVFTLLLQLHAATTSLDDKFFVFRRQESVPPPLLKLRQRLLWFSKTLFDYTTNTAHEIHNDMMQSMTRAADIDEMVSVLARYEKRLQTNLLLASNLEPIRDTIIGTLELSEVLAKIDRAIRISSLQQQFEKSMRFLVAGIRGVGRAGGESFLEGLAETLEWGVR